MFLYSPGPSPSRPAVHRRSPSGAKARSCEAPASAITTVPSASCVAPETNSNSCAASPSTTPSCSDGRAGIGSSAADAGSVYLAIGKTKDKTGRGGGKVDRLVRKTLSRASSVLRGSVIAPRGESAAQAKKVLRKHRQLGGC